ncbi:TMEM165/GDT1 family protein [Acidothermaceae bacterium B102]|nr:TMEM165/GDT1 family protein [Acidothermaceae bacterium B102]
MSFGILFGVAAVIFLAELPDKSLIATLVLGTRYRASWVWFGVATAFLVHVVIAVAAGGALALLPHRLVEAIVSALFFVGAALVLFSHEDDEEEEVETDADQLRAGPSFGKVFLTSFTLIFIGEWGDITQIATANYAAKYDDPLSVGIGATLGLWLVSGLAVTVGARLLNHVPVMLLRRVTAVILLVFGVVSAVAAIRG